MLASDIQLGACVRALLAEVHCMPQHAQLALVQRHCCPTLFCGLTFPNGPDVLAYHVLLCWLLLMLMLLLHWPFAFW